MDKEKFNSWLGERVQFQAKITIGAVAAMAALGLVGLIIQGAILFYIFKLSAGTFPAIVVVLGFFAGGSAFTWFTAPKELADDEHEVDIDGKTVPIKVARTMSNAWTYALGSRDSEIGILERIFGLLTIVPRMFFTAWHLFKRITAVKEIDTRECGAILRFVLKKAERVNIIEIADKRPQTELTKTMRQLSLVDGVVFLSRGEVGLTPANRFKEDVEKARGGSQTAKDPNTPFDVG